MNEILFLLLAGLLAGFIGGMFGVGGGLIIVPVLVFMMGFSQHAAQGTSTATLLFPIGILAAYKYNESGAVNWKFAFIMAFTFIIGAYFGSKFALDLNQKILKRCFSAFLLVVSIKMFWDSLK